MIKIPRVRMLEVLFIEIYKLLELLKYKKGEIMLHEQAYQHNQQVVSDFYPNILWDWFARIGAIAHPSYHEEALVQEIITWARQHHLQTFRDDVGNVIIKKPATQGMQNRMPIALQAHLDMVPQANADKQHDFTKDPIMFKRHSDADWLMADGTTLGADNGIGMASCLALLQSDDIAHPELEILLTITEESGMVGAMQLAPNTLSATLMINTDTEEIAEVYVGCAGGIDADLSLPIDVAKNTFDAALNLKISGLRGGHSGLDIDKNRSSAIMVLARMLSTLQKEFPKSFALQSIHGGSLRNAIAREASAILLCQRSDIEKIQASCQKIANVIHDEIKLAEPDFRCQLEDAQPTESMITNSSQVIDLLNALPNGVIRMSDVATDTVETSLSVGKVSTDSQLLHIVILVRSLVESAKYAVCQSLSSLANLSGASAKFDVDYTGWRPEKDSALTALTVDLYTSLLGEPPKIKVIHAGLECGLIKRSHPHLDIVSVGPTIKNAHSPDEMVHIGSVGTYWQLLVSILENAPLKFDN